jgi:hypothetical protein
MAEREWSVRTDVEVHVSHHPMLLRWTEKCGVHVQIQRRDGDDFIVTLRGPEQELCDICATIGECQAVLRNTQTAASLP